MTRRPWRRRTGVVFARLLRSRGEESRAPGGALSVAAHAGAIVLLVTSAGRASPADLRPVSVTRDTVLYFVTTTAPAEDASGGTGAVGERTPRVPPAIADVYRTHCVIDFPRESFADWSGFILAEPPPPPVPDSLAARDRPVTPLDASASEPPSADEPFVARALDCWSEVLARPSHLHYTEAEP